MVGVETEKARVRGQADGWRLPITWIGEVICFPQQEVDNRDNR
jgi:hypothetical protein